MKWIYGLALVGLAACGPLGRNSSTFDAVRGVAGASVVSESPEAGPLNGWSLAGITEQSSDRLLLNMFDRGIAIQMVQIGTNGSRTTWVNAEGVTITLEDGVILATRGLGGDLMGVDAPVKGDGFQTASNHLRTHDFLNGLGQIERHEFRCETHYWKEETVDISEQSYLTTVYREGCDGEQVSFTNTYWVTMDGSIKQSSQWISPEVGFLGYQHL